MSRTNIPMTKENKLGILTRAREIITDPDRWNRGRLKSRAGEQFCVLGACERAAYDLGLAIETSNSFGRGPYDSVPVDAYDLGRDLSLYRYSVDTYGSSPDWVNDNLGHEQTLEMLDRYIAVVERS